jgi:hypothetical protein
MLKRIISKSNLFFSYKKPMPASGKLTGSVDCDEGDIETGNSADPEKQC